MLIIFLLSCSGQYHAGKRPWQLVDQADVALPSATQNELDDADAAYLVAHGVKYLFEGANMPSTPAAIEVFKASGGAYFPAKAANSGSLPVNHEVIEELNDACRAIRFVRETLIKAIGLKPQREPEMRQEDVSYDP